MTTRALSMKNDDHHNQQQQQHHPPHHGTHLSSSLPHHHHPSQQPQHFQRLGVVGCHATQASAATQTLAAYPLFAPPPPSPAEGGVAGIGAAVAHSGNVASSLMNPSADWTQVVSRIESLMLADEMPLDALPEFYKSLYREPLHFRSHGFRDLRSFACAVPCACVCWIYDAKPVPAPAYPLDRLLLRRALVGAASNAKLFVRRRAVTLFSAGRDLLLATLAHYVLASEAEAVTSDDHHQARALRPEAPFTTAASTNAGTTVMPTGVVSACVTADSGACEVSRCGMPVSMMAATWNVNWSRICSLETLLMHLNFVSLEGFLRAIHEIELRYVSDPPNGSESTQQQPRLFAFLRKHARVPLLTDLLPDPTIPLTQEVRERSDSLLSQRPAILFLNPLASEGLSVAPSDAFPSGRNPPQRSAAPTSSNGATSFPVLHPQAPLKQGAVLRAQQPQQQPSTQQQILSAKKSSAMLAQTILHSQTRQQMLQISLEHAFLQPPCKQPRQQQQQQHGKKMPPTKSLPQIAPPASSATAAAVSVPHLPPRSGSFLSPSSPVSPRNNLREAVRQMLFELVSASCEWQNLCWKQDEDLVEIAEAQTLAAMLPKQLPLAGQDASEGNRVYRCGLFSDLDLPSHLIDGGRNNNNNNSNHGDEDDEDDDDDDDDFEDYDEGVVTPNGKTNAACGPNYYGDINNSYRAAREQDNEEDSNKGSPRQQHLDSQSSFSLNAVPAVEVAGEDEAKDGFATSAFFEDQDGGGIQRNCCNKPRCSNAAVVVSGGFSIGSSSSCNGRSLAVPDCCGEDDEGGAGTAAAPASPVPAGCCGEDTKNQRKREKQEIKQRRRSTLRSFRRARRGDETSPAVVEDLLTSLGDAELARRRNEYRRQHVGVFVSSVKLEWDKYFDRVFPLSHLMELTGTRKLKTLLAEVPNLVLMGDGGFMKVLTVHHARLLGPPFPPSGLDASGMQEHPSQVTRNSNEPRFQALSYLASKVSVAAPVTVVDTADESNSSNHHHLVATKPRSKSSYYKELQAVNAIRFPRSHLVELFGPRNGSDLLCGKTLSVWELPSSKVKELLCRILGDLAVLVALKQREEHSKRHRENINNNNNNNSSCSSSSSSSCETILQQPPKLSADSKAQDMNPDAAEGRRFPEAGSSPHVSPTATTSSSETSSPCRKSFPLETPLISSTNPPLAAPASAAAAAVNPTRVSVNSDASSAASCATGKQQPQQQQQQAQRSCNTSHLPTCLNCSSDCEEDSLLSQDSTVAASIWEDHALRPEHESLVQRFHELGVTGLRIADLPARWNSSFVKFSPFNSFVKKAGLNSSAELQQHLLSLPNVLVVKEAGTAAALLLPSSLEALEDPELQRPSHVTLGGWLRRKTVAYLQPCNTDAANRRNTVGHIALETPPPTGRRNRRGSTRRDSCVWPYLVAD